MSHSNHLTESQFKKGARVTYRGIPNQVATVVASAQGKLSLKYPREKGYLKVPVSHCSLT